MTRWDQRYASGDSQDKPPEPLVIRAAQLLPPGRALDIACGTGRNALYLAAQGWHVALHSGPPCLAHNSKDVAEVRVRT